MTSGMGNQLSACTCWFSRTAGKGPDTMTDHQGRDLARPGPGRDTINTRPGRDAMQMPNDGVPDVINCGPGHDIVDNHGPVDPSDTYIGCEEFIFSTD